jgi:hypothetical protein
MVGRTSFGEVLFRFVRRSMLIGSLLFQGAVLATLSRGVWVIGAVSLALFLGVPS